MVEYPDCGYFTMGGVPYQSVPHKPHDVLLVTHPCTTIIYKLVSRKATLIEHAMVGKVD